MQTTLQIEAPTSASENLAPIILLIGTILAISVLSGFQASPVPYELAWRFSPIGFLESALNGGLPAEYLELPTANYFRGPSGFSLDYATVFLKTCFCEAPFYFWCLRKEHPLRSLQILLTANFLTHPIVFFVFPLIFSRYVPAALWSEFFAAVTEMLFVGFWVTRSHGRLSGAKAAILILLANLFSWELGMFVS